MACRQEKLGTVAAGIRADTGVDTRSIAVDLAEPTAMDRIAEATSDLEIGMIMYCAGADPDYQPFLANPVEIPLALVHRILREVADIRRTGHAINRGESETGVVAMGIACTVPEADILAGLGVSGPDSTTDENWETQVARELREATTELAKQIRAYHL